MGQNFVDDLGETVSLGIGLDAGCGFVGAGQFRDMDGT
jgi:hypothetical protein